MEILPSLHDCVIGNKSVLQCTVNKENGIVSWFKNGTEISLKNNEGYVLLIKSKCTIYKSINNTSLTFPLLLIYRRIKVEELHKDRLLVFNCVDIINAGVYECKFEKETTRTIVVVRKGWFAICT